MKLAEIDAVGVSPALKLLPAAMDSPEARVGMFAIGLQESEFEHRAQVVINSKKQKVKGPARSFWQFEKGTRTSRGGVWGIYLHEASRYWLAQVCAARGVKFHPDQIWAAIENDDVLAAACARLLIFTDPKKLPAMTDQKGWWDLYAKRCWRPGKPHPKVWPGNHMAALAYVQTCGGAA